MSCALSSRAAVLTSSRNSESAFTNGSAISSVDTEPSEAEKRGLMGEVFLRECLSRN